MTARPVRIGTGAACSGDRIDPGIDMAARGALDPLVSEARGLETNVGGDPGFAGGGLTRAWLER